MTCQKYSEGSNHQCESHHVAAGDNVEESARAQQSKQNGSNTETSLDSPATSCSISDEYENVRKTIAVLLNDVRRAWQEAQATQDKAEKVLIDVVNSASSLSELRPSRLRSVDTNHMVLSQIADRLANLVHKEVQICFKSYFNTLHTQMNNAVITMQTVLNALPSSMLKKERRLKEKNITRRKKPAKSDG